MIDKLRRDRRYVRSLLFLVFTASILAWAANFLSAGFPWGVDDGVKRVTARQFTSTGFKSCLIIPSDNSFSEDFFPIAEPYVEPTTGGFRSIFPSFFPALGGIFFALFGYFGFYLLPAFSLMALLALFSGRFLKAEPISIKTWSILILAGPLLFYGMTFWEHAFALLMTIPVVYALSKKEVPLSRWLIAGISFGLAVYLRPETALMFPIAAAIIVLRIPREIKAAGVLTAGVIASLSFAGLFEYYATGTFLPEQIFFNLGLSLESFNLSGRVRSLFLFIFNFPGYPKLALMVLISLVVLALITRKWLIAALGIPILSIVALVQAYTGESAFAITASSQGLFFAFPWIIISLIPVKGVKKLDNPYFILGWCFIIFAYLFGPDSAGMHWGPRFIFPALIPLVCYSVSVLKSLPPAQVKWFMIVSGTAVLLNAAVSVQALSERGRVLHEVDNLIRDSGSEILILDRWHQGADMEPLWGKMDIGWAQVDGDREELLVALEERAYSGGICWIQSGDEYDLEKYPVIVESSDELPSYAGWGGNLHLVYLAGLDDLRWGNLYWHTGLRRAETGQLSEALEYLQKAAAIFPASADIYYNLAVCYGQMGHTRKAISQLKEALKLNPAHTAARVLARRLGIIP